MGRIDDVTVALVLQLHREPDSKGGRRSCRDIANECKRLGSPVGHVKVAEIISEAHRETIGAATSHVREKIAGALDVNVERITKMATLLAHVAEHGQFPGEVVCDSHGEAIIPNAAQRVTAAREAVVASAQLLSAVGVSQPAGNEAEDVVRRIRQIYGYDVADAEKAEREDESVSVGDEASALPTPMAH